MASKPSTFCKVFLTLYCLFLRKLAGRHSRRSTATATTKPRPPPPPLERLHGQTLVVDMEGWLLRSPVSTFPYFMLVAVEAGGFLRGLLLLVLYPLIRLLGDDMRLRAMVMVCFFGLEEKEVARVGRTVLPKFFLEETAMEGLEVVREAGKVVAVTAAFPKVMVEGFLKEYLGVAAVVGPEVKAISGVLVGLVEEEEEEEVVVVANVEVGKLQALLGAEAVKSKGGGGGAAAVGLAGGRRDGREHYLFSRYCKETFALTEADKEGWRSLPREKYPKPLIFHDGRLALTPTPYAALALYTYLPVGITLAIFRSIAFVFLPYRVFFLVGALTGVHYRLVAGPAPVAGVARPHGRLYVCNHRTLLDPITVAAALGSPVTAVTYSLSRLSEMIAPIRTARLTRDREEDRRNMQTLLSLGDVVVCPEGTTCREPYLLRFSPLFAELGVDVNPVALNTSVDMFYGTSTKPAAKWLDPFYLMMNPRPSYRVEFLPRAAATPVDGGDRVTSIDVANRVQRELGNALGFELTELTRKDKYMMLAGNEGVVKATPNY